MNLLIFGAQGYALGAYNAITTLYPRRTISCFVVSRMGNNAQTLGGISVREIGDLAIEMTDSDKMNTSIIIATPENVQPEIEETLELYGFHNYSRLTSERWDELMKLYHTKLGKFQPLSTLPVGCNKPFVRMYMAKSHVDRPLKQTPVLRDFVFPLQVGTDNASTRIADLTDNTGNNISRKNGNYSELTGLYWLWKNKLCESLSYSLPIDKKSESGSDDEEVVRETYYGIGQYRRMLEFSQDDLLRLNDNKVDVVLPYPMPYEPNIHAHHERYLKDADWDALLTALKELQPEYAESFSEVLNQQYLYNYNVILAKKRVLREYCEWLFPILERVEELSTPKGKDRKDRYIGYMGETLETLYFIKNADKLNVVHTVCKLYV